MKLMTPPRVTAASEMPEHLIEYRISWDYSLEVAYFLRNNPPSEGRHPSDRISSEAFMFVGTKDVAEVILAAGGLSMVVLVNLL